jgi:NTP pyrophosphatase (non-canonical NTP hydrolase)
MMESPFYPVETLLKRCVEKWGTDSQIAIAIEECAELIKALCKMNRVGINDADFSFKKERMDRTLDKLRGEIADVELSVQQLKFIFGEDEIEKKRQMKIKRLRARLDFEDGKNVCPYCGTDKVTWNWFSNDDKTVWWHECWDCPGNPTFATKGRRGEP